MKKIIFLCLVLSVLLIGCTNPLTKLNPSPLKIIDTKVTTKTNYGIVEKEFQVFVENVSDKEIIAYKVNIKGYNSFDEHITINFSDVFQGIVQNVSIKPNEIYGYNSYWSSVYANTVNYIKAEITEVKFADGSKWTK
jgi:hypothetical protein